jgi:signal transduction histidine kinase
MRNFCFFIVYLFLLSNIFAQQQVIIAPKSEKLAFKVSSVEIAGQDTPLQSSYDIEYDRNALKIYFTANLVNTIYKYRLIEYEYNQKVHLPWQTTKEPFVKFNNSPSARYTFEVLAINNSQQTSSIFLEFKVDLPWWRSWWFWASCFVAMFGLFYGREKFLQFWAAEEQRHVKQVTELELRTLQLQMNPHFVFNALNAVQSFIVTHDSISANNYLSKFAHLIRLFLDSSRSKYISLSDEVKLLSLYTEMEMLRFDNKFDFSLNVAPDVNRFVEIPTMMLQPFVENAINHGLRYSTKKGSLKIDFYNQGKHLVCRVEDTGVGRERAKQIQSKSRKGYKSQGLKIMEERLKIFNLISDSDIQFSIGDKIKNPTDPETDVGTLVEIKFPRNS